MREREPQKTFHVHLGSVVRARRGSRSSYHTNSFWVFLQFIESGWVFSWPNTRSLAQKPHEVVSRVMTFFFQSYDFNAESESVSCSVMSDSLQTCGLQPARLLCLQNSPGKNPRVGNHSLLQGISLIQRSNLDLLYCRQILYLLSHEGSPFKNFNAEGNFKKSCW